MKQNEKQKGKKVPVRFPPLPVRSIVNFYNSFYIVCIVVKKSQSKHYVGNTINNIDMTLISKSTWPLTLTIDNVRCDSNNVSNNDYEWTAPKAKREFKATNTNELIFFMINLKIATNDTCTNGVSNVRITHLRVASANANISVFSY